MGLEADAYLVFGVPIVAHDSYTGEPTKFWNEEEEDWVNLDSDYLEIFHYGHYEDPDGPRGILTNPRIQQYRGDCWDPKPIDDPWALEVSDKARSKASDASRALNLDVDFYTNAMWNLVASYG